MGSGNRLPPRKEMIFVCGMNTETESVGFTLLVRRIKNVSPKATKRTEKTKRTLITVLRI